MRVAQHVTDTKGIKKVLGLLPDHWVVRDLSERDYGIDLLVEIFHEITADKNSNKRYEPSGYICHLQLKSSRDPLVPTKKKTVGESMSIPNLRYAERYLTPLILVSVDVSDKKAPCYFIWVQRYIREVLNIEEPNWRKTPPTPQGSAAEKTLRIPTTNIFTPPFKKLEAIAARSKYVDELVEFSEVYTQLSDQLENHASNGTMPSAKMCEEHIKAVRQLLNLRTLFEYNECYVDSDTINKLLRFLADLKSRFEQPAAFYAFEEKKGLGVLANELRALTSLENQIAQFSDDTVY